MRDCPVCTSQNKTILGDYEAGFTLYRCNWCGMRFLDAPFASQDYFDGYYKNDVSPDLQGADSIERLQRLAEILPNGRGLDVGGKYSPLQKMILGLQTLNAGEPMSGVYDYIVLSHTLEHVYDVPGLMRNIHQSLWLGGKLIIEGPIWTLEDPTTYDFHWQHVNKFYKEDLEYLLERHNFTVLDYQLLEPFQGYNCARIIGVKS